MNVASVFVVATVNHCVMMHAGLCVVVCIICLMCSSVVCDIVWFVFVFLFLCVPCLNVCVNVTAVICVCL